MAPIGKASREHKRGRIVPQPIEPVVETTRRRGADGVEACRLLSAQDSNPLTSKGFPVKVRIDKLHDAPTPFGFEATPQWWQQEPGRDRELRDAVCSPIAIAVDAQRMGANLFLEGTLVGELELVCSRCVTRYRAPIRERFRLLLEPAGERVPADPEAARALAEDGLTLTDELETGWFRGSEIELDRFVREAITLLFPVQPLCKEDCQGLCPRCGGDRNLEPCECVELRPESPFAVLAGLRTKTAD